MSITRQFQNTAEEIANELWAAIKNRYHRANHAQMMAIESKLANLKIHDKFCASSNGQVA